MKTELIEIRDRATFIPAVAIEFNGGEHFLLRKAGFAHERHIMLIKLVDSRVEVFSARWGDRTMQTAHQHLEDVGLEGVRADGVLDVEFVLGETSEPKRSEQQTIHPMIHSILDAFNAINREIVK